MLLFLLIYKHIYLERGETMSAWWKKENSKLNKIINPDKMPFGTMPNSSHFEINSNREVIVEGSKGILQYDENIIRVNMGNMIVSFSGRKLSLKCLSTDSLIVVGFITSIEFIT